MFNENSNILRFANIIFLCIIMLLIQSTQLVSSEKSTELVILGVSEETHNLKYFVKNLNTNEEFAGFSKVSDFQFLVPVGVYFVEMFLDVQTTKSFDYFYTGNILITNETSEVNLFFLPVGALELFVLDTSGRAISNVLVHIRCDKNHGSQGYFNTDEMGVLLLENLPNVDCFVRTAHKDIVLSESITIEKGSIKELSFVFPAEKNNSLLLTIMLLLIIVGVLFLLFYFLFKKLILISSDNKIMKKQVLVKRVSAKKANNDDNKKDDRDDDAGDKDNTVVVGTLNFREDALSVLNAQEKRIVNFLINSEIEKNEVYQAKIVHALSIPKTTLAKILPILESKKIILIEKIGKAKKVKLTPWFKKED
jgi:hypothetical protein